MAGNEFNPLALKPEVAAKLLSKASGESISLAQIESDIDAGAPTNADGTINLLHFAAWLVREMNHGD